MARELTIDDAMAHFGVSRSTLMRWIKGGKVKSRRVGRRRLVLVEEKADWPGEPTRPGIGDAAGEPSGPFAADAVDRGAGEVLDVAVAVRDRSEETALVLLRDRVDQIERERDLAIRRIGQLEEASSHLSFWRRGMLAALVACLLVTVGGVAAWTWAWNALAVGRVEANAVRMERDRGRSELAEAKETLVATKGDLTAERMSFAQERLGQQKKLDAVEARLDDERAERVRLAQDLSTAITEAAAKELLATSRAEARQGEFDALRARLAETEAQLIALGDAKDVPREEPTTVAPVADPPAQINGAETYGPPIPQSLRVSGYDDPKSE